MRKLLYLQYFNPGLYPSLIHSSTMLAEQGWQVKFFGVGALGDADGIAIRPHPNISIERMKFEPAGWRQKAHYLLFALRALWIAATWRPTWIYLSDPFACPIGLVLSAWPWWRILYHEHDTPDSSDEGWMSGFMRLIYRSRNGVSRRAAACVVPGEARRDHFLQQTQTARPTYVVRNCPSRCEAQTTGRDRRADFVLFYHGTLVPDRLPLTILQALSRVRERVTLRFAGYETVEHVGYVSRLHEVARKLGLGDRVHYLGAMSRDDLLEACSQADVGLSLIPLAGGDLNLRTMVGPSVKPFDYLARGLALLVSDLTEWKAAFVAPGYGIACKPDDAQSLASAIAWFVENREAVHEMGERGRGRVLDDWNYETQFEPVAHLLRSS